MLEIFNRTETPAYEPPKAPVAPDKKMERQTGRLNTKETEEKKVQDELKKATLQNLEEEQKKTKEKEVTQQMLNEIAHDMEILYSVGLQFAKHNDSGRTMVKVINKDTDELIREIPAEKVLDMAAKMEEMIGLLFDQEA